MYASCLSTRPNGGLSGLGQTDDQVLGVRDILLSMISSSLTRLAPYGSSPATTSIRAKIAEAERWFKGGLSRFYDFGNNADALRSFTNGITIMHQVVPMIAQLSPADAKALQAQNLAYSMGSVSAQLTESVRSLSDPVASAIEAVSPAAAAAVRSSPWLFPLLGGGALLFFLRR